MTELFKNKNKEKKSGCYRPYKLNNTSTWKGVNTALSKHI